VRSFSPSGRTIGSSNSRDHPRSLMTPALFVEFRFIAFRHSRRLVVDRVTPRAGSADAAADAGCSPPNDRSGWFSHRQPQPSQSRHFVRRFPGARSGRGRACPHDSADRASREAATDWGWGWRGYSTYMRSAFMVRNYMRRPAIRNACPHRRSETRRRDPTLGRSVQHWLLSERNCGHIFAPNNKAGIQTALNEGNLFVLETEIIEVLLDFRFRFIG
jgi:hypothetical protein